MSLSSTKFVEHTIDVSESVAELSPEQIKYNANRLAQSLEQDHVDRGEPSPIPIMTMTSYIEQALTKTVERHQTAVVSRPQPVRTQHVFSDGEPAGISLALQKTIRVQSVREDGMVINHYTYPLKTTYVITDDTMPGEDFNRSLRVRVLDSPHTAFGILPVIYLKAGNPVTEVTRWLMRGYEVQVPPCMSLVLSEANIPYIPLQGRTGD